MRACVAFLFTCALTAVLSAIALTGTIVLGAMPVSLALLISAVVAYAIVGLRPLTVALASATVLTILVDGSDATRLEVERAMDALAEALSVIME